MANRTKTQPEKPAKPYDGFPLFAHATRRWCKKIRGKFHYFGPWDDPTGALENFLDQRDDLMAGRTPRLTADGFTVKDLCNSFLTAKRHQQEAGDITRRTFDDYYTTCETLLSAFGKRRLVDDLSPRDFESLRASLAKTRNPNTLGNEVTRIRVAFKYAYDADLIEHPMKFGPTFKRPAKRILRAVRQGKDKKLFSAKEIRDILEIASKPMKAMTLLGINCGFGNRDCGTLPFSALDLKTGWVDFLRPKTSVECS